jgi:hypothetical protein
MARKKKLTVTFPAFSNYSVIVIFTTDFVKDANKLGVEEVTPDIECLHITNDPNTGTSWILFKEDPGIGSIVHESYHCIACMLRWVGVGAEEETVSYHLGYLVARICKYLKKVRCAD